MTGSLGYGSALLSGQWALRNNLAESELFSWGHSEWAAPSPQTAQLPHAREPAPPPPLRLPSAWGWKMWSSCGRWEPGILLFTYLTTLLAWVQSHGFPFTQSANWISVPAQPWSILRGPRHLRFHSRYALDTKSGQEKSLVNLQHAEYHLVNLIKHTLPGPPQKILIQ